MVNSCRFCSFIVEHQLYLSLVSAYRYDSICYRSFEQQSFPCWHIEYSCQYQFARSGIKPKYKKTPFFSKENLILFDKALFIERKEVSLWSKIFFVSSFPRYDIIIEV